MPQSPASSGVSSSGSLKKSASECAANGRAPLSGLSELREVPLSSALELLGIHRKADSTFAALKVARTERWHVSTSQADFELIITGRLWFDTRARKGGAGALDLVMHVLELSCGGATRLLREALRSAQRRPRPMPS